MKEERLKKLLLQLPWNNPSVSPWQTLFNGLAGSMSEYHSKNPATGASWFCFGPFNHGAYFYNLTNSREDHTEFQQKAFIALVDFRAAFDSVNREALWWILELLTDPRNIANFSSHYTMGRRAMYK
ncbi:hypothetical protein QYM36_012207 [Artemia franciscana]|uniref:Reverse transcriptase domain-containing protein n=1 Tax=Artemia franciscana TaxID=6661 RepID=A0AA88HNM4_ARTSF|nr:hypothetical protein QYM36_012207 [Artemia franciscana]